MFATRARFKREAYRGSDFAPKILAENGLQVVMKVCKILRRPVCALTLRYQSDHPVLNSRHLLYEAQQAHFYGLESNLALLSVTGTPAQVMGIDHRVGFVKLGMFISA